MSRGLIGRMQPHIRFAVVFYVRVVLIDGVLLIQLIPEHHSGQSMTPAELKPWVELGVAAVGAFFGAVAAFFMVALTDWRRNRRIPKSHCPPC